MDFPLDARRDHRTGELGKLFPLGDDLSQIKAFAPGPFLQVGRPIIGISLAAAEHRQINPLVDSLRPSGRPMEPTVSHTPTILMRFRW